MIRKIDPGTSLGSGAGAGGGEHFLALRVFLAVQRDVKLFRMVETTATLRPGRRGKHRKSVRPANAAPVPNDAPAGSRAA